MIYRLAADAVVGLHFAFILFVALGGFLSWRWPRVAWIHIPAALWGCLIEFFGWICPLTPLENRWRALAGQDGYTGGFVEHYIIPIVYPHGLTRDVQIGLGAAVLLLNITAYTVYFRRHSAARENEGERNDPMKQP